MATSINYDMDQGANFSFNVVVKDSNGNPTNISTGYTAHSQMRKFYSSSAYVGLDASITGTTGNIKVSLSATGTAAIKDGTWFYDVELHSNNGLTVERIVQGMITVYPEVTKL